MYCFAALHIRGQFFDVSQAKLSPTALFLFIFIYYTEDCEMKTCTIEISENPLIILIVSNNIAYPLYFMPFILFGHCEPASKLIFRGRRGNLMPLLPTSLV